MDKANTKDRDREFPMWKVYGEDTVACILERIEVVEWMKNDLVVLPGEAAVVLKDGKPQETITESRQKIGSWADRNLPTIKQWMGTLPDYQVLRFTTVAIPLDFTVDVLTLDHQSIPGEGVMRVSVVTDEVSRIVSLLGGRLALARHEIIERIKPEMMARVFQPVVGSTPYDEMRGNLAFLRDIEERTRVEVQQLLSTWGLKLESLTVKWGLTDEDKAVIARRARQIEDEATEFEQTRTLRELERKAEILRLQRDLVQEDRVRLERGDIDFKLLDAQGDIDLLAKLQDAGLSAQEKENLMRIRLAGVDADINLIDTNTKIAQLEIEREKDRIGGERARRELDLRKEEKQFEADQDRFDFEMIQRNERERMRMQMEHDLNLRRTEQERMRLQMDMQLQQMAIQNGTIERVLAGAGAVDPATLQAMIQEQTRMRALDRGDAVAASMFEAEAAGKNLAVFQEAEDRERQHQYKMTELSGSLMNAAKPNMPGPYPYGGYAIPPASLVGQPPSVHVVNVQPGQAGPSPTAAAGFDGACPKCGGGVRSGWNVCPACAELLG